MLLTRFFSTNRSTQALFKFQSRRFVPLMGVLLCLLLAWPALAQELTLADRLQALAHTAEEGMEAAAHNDVTLMQAEFDEIHEAWESFEDRVREQNPTAYVELEGALDALKASLQAQPLDSAAVEKAYAHLMDEATEIAARFNGGAPVAATAIEATPADLMKNLDVAYHELEEGEADKAAEYLAQVIRAWPSVEGAIAAKSQEAYTAIEVDLSRAAAALKAEPANLSEAEAAVERLRETLLPFVGGQTYTMFDAAAIILREGLEALLIVVALLAFLRRSGNSDKRAWIWVGGGLGVLASIAVAFALQAVFSRASAGQNREVIEGVTGLVAAGLLFYVSYWLHSKANLHSWQKYINQSTSRALAGGSVAGLAMLSFLAVFREGAETAVFYLGMASSITLENLLLGLGLGVALLGVAAVLMLLVGMKLPLRPFFQVAGLLVYYLGFKFLGTGIHALQVAGILPTSPIPALPPLPLIGFYPTWETTLPQLALLATALVAFLYLRAQERRAQIAAQTAAV
ncbi:MAG: FTR1 family protein [Anaerolineae bacterium]|nr:FTR1 family protein [Anaerolineae bacterium]